MRRSRATSSLALLALVSSLAACRARSPELEPRPEAVSPAWGDPAAATPVRITGRFRVKASQALGSSSGNVVEAGYQAWLDGTPLDQVRWLDERTLAAVVPAGLAAGPHGLQVVDPAGRAGSLPGAFFAGTPAVTLSQSVLLTASTVSVGQALTVTVTVGNAGNATAPGVLPEVTRGGAGALAPGATPAPVDLPPASSHAFDLGFTGASPGTVALDVTTAVTAPTGGTASAPPWSGSVLVQAAASLAGELAIPVAMAPGDFTVTLTVTNSGEATAAGVQAGPLAVAPGSTATAAEKAPFGAALDIPGGEARSFTATWTATGTGSLALTGGAAGGDANGGWAVTTGTVTSNVSDVGVPPSVDPIGVDPAGDGSPFAFVNAYAGKVWIGPNQTARTVAQLGSGAPTQLAFALPKDTSNPGTTSRNSLSGAPPYPSLGSAACILGLVKDACGPDLEDARGAFSVETIASAEWVVAGQGRLLGDVRYVYLSPAGASPLPFRYVDLKLVLGATASGLTATAVLQDVLYLGFSGPAPQLLVLRTLPASPGQDANAGVDGDDLNLDLMPGVGSSGTPANGASMILVDALATFGGKLYAGNNGGLVRSTTAAPRKYTAHPEDWVASTPSQAAWGTRTAITSLAGSNLLPRSRAIPAFASWMGRLFAIRNTTAGPQLWVCDPAATGDATACDPGDWALGAPNASGDTSLSQLGDPGSSRATLLVATASWLYLGLESSAGVRLFRTSAAVPAAADFRGQGNCAAGTTGCQGLGGDGLGDPPHHTRFMDARALSPASGAGLHFTAGNGTDPVRVYRILD